MTDARDRAVDEVRQMAVAIRTLGGRATAADIARATGLPLRTVQRRLNGSSGHLVGPAMPVLFAPAAARGTWGLTVQGTELAGSSAGSGADTPATPLPAAPPPTRAELSITRVSSSDREDCIAVAVRLPNGAVEVQVSLADFARALTGRGGITGEYRDHRRGRE